MTRRQAHRTLRIPAYYFTLALMLVSAAIVAGALWLGLAVLLSLKDYIPVLP